MSDTKNEPQLTPLQAAEAKREARKAKASAAHDAQLATDLDAIDALEELHGDSNVAVVRLDVRGYVPGLPAAVAARCPKPGELKRFRDQTKPQKDGRNRDVQPDHIAAVELVAESCLVYPDAEVFAKLCAARPGLAAQLGKEAVGLAVGREESEGKGR